MNRLKYLREEKGITLLALVITIIITLILAGTAIGSILDDDSLLKTMSREKEQTENKVNFTEEKLEDLQNQVAN